VTGAEAESLALSCYGAAIRVVDTAGTGVCASLRANRPAWFARENGDPPAATFVVLPRGAHGYSVERDGVEALRTASPGDVIAWIGSEVDRALAEEARLGLFVHAGVVGWRGYAVVVPGRSATGKSVLVQELVRRGATYFSDEYAVFDDRGLVHSYARTPMLRDEAGRPQPSALDRPVEDAPPDPLPVALLVSTVYRPAVPWRPDVRWGTRAVLPVVDNAVLARAQGARTLRIAARLAPTVVTLQGPRPDAEAIAPRLLELLDEALEKSPGIGGKDGSLLAVARSRLAATPAIPSPERPARHVRIEDFLSPAEHERLLAYATASEAQYQESQVMGEDGQSHLDHAFRRSRTLFRIDDAVWESVERRLRRALAHVRAELGLPWFPLDHVERQLTAHGDGGLFGAHTDNGRAGVAARRVTCVYYLHRTPPRFTGGELRLYDWTVRHGRAEHARSYTTVTPVSNSAVFFPSDTLHEVVPVQRESDDFGDSRFALNIWFWAGQFPTWHAARQG
jgi:Rps23 Pro-64 3,4-dihydroxylase Tpa1-like proline 4-hydroxylase